LPSDLGATMPVESLGEARPAVVVDNRDKAPSSPDAASSSAKRSASARAADPMAETPIHARLPPAPPSRASGELTLLPTSARAKKRSSVAPYVGVVVALGAGVLYFFVRSSGPDDAGRGRDFRINFGPSASAHSRARSQLTTSTGAAHVAVAPSAAPTSSGSASALPSTAPDDMVEVAPGKYALGEAAEARMVVLTRRVFLDKLEVTTRAYLDCVAARQCGSADRVTAPTDLAAAPAPPPPTGSASAAASASAAPAVAAAPSPEEFVAVWSRRCNAPRRALDHPINCVDFRGADAFCRFKGKRLPTEDEWEAAARGHEARPFAWGDAQPECGRACFDKNGACLSPGDDSIATCPGGVHLADKTPEGILDMGGDVAEWTADGFVARPPGGLDPLGDPSAPLRVVRGGSFLDAADRLRATFRVGAAPDTAAVNVGFRCAMDAAPPDPAR
ncbi:MAG TPA: SUMF1/EgtB/PvdO family nonheme iron enzyme, partial [Byssovorax sp.]